MKIVVLGAGVVGVTSAWVLAQAGHEVAVIERRDGAGLETSFANGGQVSASHAEPWARPGMIRKLAGWIGRDDAPLVFRPRADWAMWQWGMRFLLECGQARFARNCRALAGLATYSQQCLQALRRDTGIRYDELSRGILRFFTSRAELDLLSRHAQVRTAAECLAIEPALQHSEVEICGGVYEPSEESGDAYKFTAELAKLSAAQGVRFSFGLGVESLESKNRSITGVRTPSGTITADAYIVSLGSYSPLLVRPLGIRLPIYPLKGYSVTLPLGPAEAAAAPSVSLSDDQAKLVISRLGNRLRVAGTAELSGYDTSVDEARCDGIVRRVRALFPQLRPITEIETWAGLRPATPGNVPVIGRTKYQNLFLNTGHGTLGWTLACGSARALADVVSGRRPEVEFPFHA